MERKAECFSWVPEKNTLTQMAKFIALERKAKGLKGKFNRAPENCQCGHVTSILGGTLANVSKSDFRKISNTIF